MYLLYVMMSSVSNTISSSSKGKHHDLQACIDKKCCRGQSYRRNRHTLTEFSVPELPATKFLCHNSRNDSRIIRVVGCRRNTFCSFSRFTNFFPFSLSHQTWFISLILKSSVLEGNRHFIETRCFPGLEKRSRSRESAAVLFLVLEHCRWYARCNMNDAVNKGGWSTRL